MKRCKFDGRLNPLGELFCGECGSVLSDDDVVTDDMPEGEATLEIYQAEVMPGLASGALCFAVWLEFPWGLEEIDCQLNVGRDPDFSPLWSQIADIRYVSKRHAELYRMGSALLVRHVGTTNPTFINGRPLATGEEIMVRDGDRIGFSSHLEAFVLLRSA